jgi:hypothetical protein
MSEFPDDVVELMRQMYLPPPTLEDKAKTYAKYNIPIEGTSAETSTT